MPRLQTDAGKVATPSSQTTMSGPSWQHYRAVSSPSAPIGHLEQSAAGGADDGMWPKRQTTASPTNDRWATSDAGPKRRSSSSSGQCFASRRRHEGGCRPWWSETSRSTCAAASSSTGWCSSPAATAVASWWSPSLVRDGDFARPRSVDGGCGGAFSGPGASRPNVRRWSESRSASHGVCLPMGERCSKSPRPGHLCGPLQLATLQSSREVTRGGRA